MAEYLAYPIMMFVATPFFLRWLGPVQYGQWILLLTLTGFGGLAGFGMGPSIVKDVAASRVSGDVEGLKKAVGACLTVALLAATILGVFLIVFGFSVGTTVFQKVGGSFEIARLTCFAAMLIGIEQIDGVFSGILKGLERYDQAARIEITSKILLVLISIAVVASTGSFGAMLTATLITNLLRLTVKWFAAKTALNIGLLRPRWDLNASIKVLSFGGWIWIQSIGMVLFSAADRALVGAVLGASALAHYAIALQLTQQIQSIPAAGVQVLFPAITRLIATGKSYRTLTLQATALVFAFSLTAAIGLIVVHEPLLRIWLGEANALAVGPLIAPLAIANAMLAATAAPYFVLLGAGQVRFVAIVALLGGVVGLIVLWVMMGTQGLNAVAWSRNCYSIICLVMLIRMYLLLKRNSQEKIGI
jgi:O-antigen/teichoic acid export membrane protein